MVLCDWRSDHIHWLKSCREKEASCQKNTCSQLPLSWGFLILVLLLLCPHNHFVPLSLFQSLDFCFCRRSVKGPHNYLLIIIVDGGKLFAPSCSSHAWCWRPPSSALLQQLGSSSPLLAWWGALEAHCGLRSPWWCLALGLACEEGWLPCGERLNHLIEASPSRLLLSSR